MKRVRALLLAPFALLAHVALGGCVATQTSRPDGNTRDADSVAASLVAEGKRVAQTGKPEPVGAADAGNASRDDATNEQDDCARTGVTDVADARGCAPFTGVIEGVDFPSDGTVLSEAARNALAPLVAALLQHPDVRLELQGHTDNRGTAADNLVLSKRRVMAVVRFLVSEGVAPGRLEPWGYGENRPLASNATAEGRSKNRRIEVRALST